MTKTKYTDKFCLSCRSSGMTVFYELRNVPVHSVLLMPTLEEALNYPKGDIILGFCNTCGFISNLAFNTDMHEYSSRYEETQGFSPTFNAFHHRLATHLIKRYNLHNKIIIEIGCGKGEFLTLLCELGGNRGIGFDPTFISERYHCKGKDQVTFIKDFYSEKYANYLGDFVCCKMTLEHIQNTANFLSMIRRSIGNQLNTIVFFQVPDVVRIMHDMAFWDIYYEHCSYFSLASLAHLFRRNKLDVVDVWKDYGDQYLMIEARPGTGKGTPPLPQEDDLEELADEVVYFCGNYRQKLDIWQNRLQVIRQKGQTAVLWGSGSKAVSFLNTLKIGDEIKYVVDINPYRQGTYMAGTGQKIVAPGFLQEYKPDIVIVMNPIYCEEIQKDLEKIGLSPELITINEY